MSKGIFGVVSLLTVSTLAYIAGIRIGKIYYTEVKEYEELLKNKKNT